MKNSPPPTPQIEWTARFNNGNGGASIAIDGRSVFVTGEQARELAVALVGPARVDARASIVAFLAAEAKRFDKEARERISVEGLPEQLRAFAVLCRTLELAIERGDDLRSGECITIDDIPAADLVSIDAIGCVVGDMFTGFKQSIEAPSKTGIAIALHLGGWRVGMSVEEAHAIIARSGILLYEVTPIARATGGGE